ncbi:MAG: uncharacterized protein QOI38_598 [Sphingomonadales bacterium]|jgi:uncharacterized protein|nr:uncharacterized protein [Sphingomonadales bacterium]
MRPTLFFAIALLAAGCDAPSAAPANAATGPQLPALTGRVVDQADVIPPEREQALTAALAAVEREAGPQFVVVTVPSLGGRPIEEVGVELGRRWGIGDARRDDGVLLIVAPNERKVRIEVGYGLEASLRDERCAEIIDRDILPRFREGDLVGGIEAGSAAIIARLRASPTRDPA